VARICHLDREIGVCYGAAGLGKTEAVKEYAKRNQDVILIEVDLGHTAKALFSELHRVLGMEGFGTVHSMFNDVVEKLKDSGRLIIVDEAEHLPYKALELLRRVYDKAGVGIMLVGMPRLLSNLRGRRGEYAQLYSRVGIAARLEGLSIGDTQMIVDSVIPSANGLSRAFHSASLGNTRTLSKLIARSLRVAELNSTNLSPQVIKETANLLII
jgi:DNA transposition AAA+ family ATPase